MLTKKEADELMKLKGEARGMNMKAGLDLVRKEKGEEGIRAIERRHEELGYPLKYKDIRPMDFYPIGLSAIDLLLAKELFGFSEKELEEWSRSMVKFSIIERIFMKHFTSFKLLSKEVERVWKNHYTIGDLENPEFSKKKRYSIIRLRNFKVHPSYCSSVKGYIAKITELLVGARPEIVETKCMFRGDDYHEFKMTW